MFDFPNDDYKLEHFVLTPLENCDYQFVIDVRNFLQRSGEDWLVEHFSSGISLKLTDLVGPRFARSRVALRNYRPCRLMLRLSTSCLKGLLYANVEAGIMPYNRSSVLR